MTVIQEVVGSSCYSLLCKHNGSKDGDSPLVDEDGHEIHASVGCKKTG